MRWWLGFSFIISSIFVGCAQLSSLQDVKTEVIYKHELKLKINGKEYRGTALIDKAKEYNIEVIPPKKSDLITITSCHRHIQIEERKKRFEYLYKPVDKIESNTYCPLVISAINKKQAKFYQAFVDVLNVKRQLDANLYCNGTQKWGKGVGLCQAREGLLLKVEFPVEVVTMPDCAISKNKGKVFDIEMPKGKCVYIFKEKGRPNIYRLTTIGYEEIILED